MIKAVAGWLVGSGVLLAPTGLQATSLHPCGSIRIANTTFCFLDANGHGRYQEAEEEFCLDGWLTRGGLRCRGQGVIAKPAAESGVLKIRVLTSWDEACPGSMSVDSINTCVMAIASLRPKPIRRSRPKPMAVAPAPTRRIHSNNAEPLVALKSCVWTPL